VTQLENTELLPVKLVNHDGIGLYIHGIMPDGSENMVMDCRIELRVRGWGGLTGKGGGRGLDDNTAMDIQKMWADEICKRYNSYAASAKGDKCIK
jgi:hypothetical protein